MEFLLNCSLLYIQVHYLSSFKLQAVYQLLVQLQSMSVLFIASCHSQDDSWQYPSLKGSCSKDFIVHYMGPVDYPFHLLHPTLLSLASQFLVLVLSPPKSFPIFFFPPVVFSSNISSFFLIIPNTHDQISCHPIYIVSLPYIFLVVPLYETLCNLPFLLILTPLYILLQTFLPSLLCSLNSPSVPKCLLPLYIPSIIPGTYFFL